MSTDTRTIQAGQIFVALRGERFDGNTMVGEAAAKGARLAIVDRPEAVPAELPAGFGVLRVDDSRRALGRLAGAYRAEVLGGVQVIAVCGSNGKTTTVRMIDAVLSQCMRGGASAKSFNNEIGVPLTILSARPHDEYLVCEIGTNAPGEVAALAAIAQPDVAVITSVGREHLEQLGSLEGVAAEEASVLAWAKAGVIPADSTHLAAAAASLPGAPSRLVRFGVSESADVQVMNVSESLHGVRFDVCGGGGSARFEVPLPGRHNAMNAAAAVAVARLLGVSDERIAAGLAQARGPEMRLEVRKIGGVTIINDAYNANPDSMLAALETMQHVGGGHRQRVAVLGDMLELGDHTAAAHEEVAARAAGVVDLLVLVGRAWRGGGEEGGVDGLDEDGGVGGGLHSGNLKGRPTVDGSGKLKGCPTVHGSGKLKARPTGSDNLKGCPTGSGKVKGCPTARVVYFADVEDGRASEVAGLLQQGDCVLLKGSRRMRLERVVAEVERRAMVAT